MVDGGLMARWATSRFRRKGNVVVLLLGAVAFLWISGLSDHLFARSLDEFVWQTSLQNLKEEVERLSRSHASSPSLPATPLNEWHRDLAATPTCEIDKELPSDARIVLIIVKSAVAHFEARQAIRATWGKAASYGEAILRTVFVVGWPGDGLDADEKAKAEGRLMEESRLHGDMVISRAFADVYRTNTKKQGLSLWLSSSSPLASACSPSFVLLIDDDYMLSPLKIAGLVNERSPHDLIYEGWRIDSSPFRFRLHKHAVSLSSYPFSSYPPYITAGAVLLSARAARRMYYGSLYVAEYNFDDIYASILAKLLSIPVRHNDRFLFDAEDGWLTPGADWRTTIAAHGYSPRKLRANYQQVLAAARQPAF